MKQMGPGRPKGQLYKQDKKSVETYKIYIFKVLEGERERDRRRQLCSSPELREKGPEV